MANKKVKIRKTEHFGIQRKIVANMTTESWRNIPHVACTYEHDVTGFLAEYEKLRAETQGANKITINTLMLKVICQEAPSRCHSP